MRSFGVLLAVLFAFVATSYASIDFHLPTLEIRKDRNSTKHNGGDSTKMMCKQIKSLTVLTSLATNQTKLDELVAKFKMDTAKVDALKKKAAEATTKLQKLSSNTTLTTECAAINAKSKMKKECGQMKRLQKLANLATNATALDAFTAKHKLNSTQVDGLKIRVQNADTKFKAMQSNTTLTDFCKQMKQAGGKESATGSSTMGAGAAAPSGSAQQVAKSGASGLRTTLKIMSHISMPVVAGLFAVFL